MVSTLIRKLVSLLSDYELESLRLKEHGMFELRRQAKSRLDEAKQKAYDAYNYMQEAWEERCAARERMNDEYQKVNGEYHKARSEYTEIRSRLGIQIDFLRDEADAEHRRMLELFEKASEKYLKGNKVEASKYSEKGRKHKVLRDELNSEVKDLIQKISIAKENAEKFAPNENSLAYRKAKDIFEIARQRHEAAREEFKHLRGEQKYYQDVFDTISKEHIKAKEALNQKLDEIQAVNPSEREAILDKAGIDPSERENAKIVRKADGTIQIYSGGIGGGDGIGHGHVALDSAGHVFYERGAFEPHGSHNYID